MSLKPKRVDFNSTWKDLKETVKGVITFSNVPRAVWNDRFSGIFFVIILKQFGLQFFYISFISSDVYSLCVAYPEPLADKLYSETKKFLEEHVAATLVKVRSGGEQNLLGNYHDAWEEFSVINIFFHIQQKVFILCKKNLKLLIIFLERN